MAEGLQIKPAAGKLGILTPGMGAVSSTFMAGVEAIRLGLRLPIGSFTQMGHIRLGKRLSADCCRESPPDRSVPPPARWSPTALACNGRR